MMEGRREAIGLGKMKPAAVLNYIKKGGGGPGERGEGGVKE